MQRHAARFTTGNYYSMDPGCVANMVTQLGWDLLEHRRANHRMNPVNPGCVTNMVTQLGWDLLEHRRVKHGITMLYIIINYLANIPVHHQLNVHDSSTRGSASNKFRQINTKLNCYKYSFLPATIVSWNTLPLVVRQLLSLEQFQHVLPKNSVSSHLHR